MSNQALRDHINQFVDPYLKTPLPFANYIVDMQLQQGILTLHLRLPYPIDAIRVPLTQAWQAHLQDFSGVKEIGLTLDWQVQGHPVQTTIAIPGIKNIIAVGSGKGGVGKSTTAVNLALALSALGARTGLLDADIYGPSVPTMVGAAATAAETVAKKQLKPIERHGLVTMSIGYLVDTEAAMAWRGPMVSGALQQLLNDTKWPALDYLIIDLPPGTGDIQLTLAQKIPVTAAVVVTTPQDLALADARRAITLFNKVRIPVLGIIENMSMHSCSQCGHQEAIFASGGGEALARDLAVPLLGQVPLAMAIRAQTDSGLPTVAASDETDPLRARYVSMALCMGGALANLPTSDAHKFPKISLVQR